MTSEWKYTTGNCHSATSKWYKSYWSSSRFSHPPHHVLISRSFQLSSQVLQRPTQCSSNPQNCCNLFEHTCGCVRCISYIQYFYTSSMSTKCEPTEWRFMTNFVSFVRIDSETVPYHSVKTALEMDIKKWHISTAFYLSITWKWWNWLLCCIISFRYFPKQLHIWVQCLISSAH